MDLRPMWNGLVPCRHASKMAVALALRDSSRRNSLLEKRRSEQPGDDYPIRGGLCHRVRRDATRRDELGYCRRPVEGGSEGSRAGAWPGRNMGCGRTKIAVTLQAARCTDGSIPPQTSSSVIYRILPGEIHDPCQAINHQEATSSPRCAGSQVRDGPAALKRRLSWPGFILQLPAFSKSSGLFR